MSADSRTAALAQRLVLLSTAGTGVLALALALAWVWGRWSFGSLGRGYVPMAPSTAWLFVWLSSALWLHVRWPASRPARMFGFAAVTGIATSGVLVLARHRFGLGFSLESWLYSGPATVQGIPVGRMSPLTATGFVLLALALGLELVAAGRSRWRGALATRLAMAGGLIGIVVSLGYLTGAPLLYASDQLPMALLTAVEMVILGGALAVAANPANWLLQVLSREQAGWGGWAMILIGLVLFASIGLSSLTYLRRMTAHARARAHEELAAITTVKAQQIAGWYAERLADANIIRESAVFARSIADYLAAPASTAARDRVQSWMQSFQQNGHYDRLLLQDTQGVVRLAVPAAPNELAAGVLAREVAAALQSGQVVPVDLHLSKVETNEVEMDLLCPVALPGEPPLAVVMFEIPADEALYPLVQSWPSFSRTAEAFLVRRERGEVVYLTDLRHRPGAALRLRQPLDPSQWVAVRAPRDLTTATEGLDYRGAPVLSALRPVTGTPWVLAAKVDQEEIYAPVRRQTWLMISILVTVATALYLSLGLLSQQRHADLLRRQLAGERERRRLGQRLTHLLKNANDIIVLADDQWRILEANDRAVESYGYPLAELQRMSVAELRAPEAHADFAQFATQLQTQQQVIVETVHRRRDGTSFPVEISARRVEIDGVTYNLAITRDITRRKRAEDAIRESEERYRRLFETESDAIFLLDCATNLFIDANPAAEKMYGYRRAELLGMKPDDISAEPDKTRQAIASRTTIIPLRWHRRQDGTVFPVGISGSYFDFQSRRIHVATIRDLTEQHQLEAQLRQAQKMEAIGQLAGGVAHDFNNLLNVILGFGELALAKLDPANPLYGHISQMKKAGERAAGLTRQLLAFSRKQILEPKLLDLNVVVTDLHGMLRRLVREDIDIVLALAPAVSRIKADPGQLEQVITNLVVNARDAMPQGGLLTIQTANVTLTAADVRLQPDLPPGEYARLSLRDTGTGMTEAVKARIFEPFFTTKPVGQGTGLGLATCYGAVKQNGGHIVVESEPGRGTTFHTYLPRLPAGTADVADDEPLGPLPVGQETILLAEDDEAVRQLTELILTKLGYRVLTAVNGEDGLRVARENRGAIQLLVTDAVMPKMSGKQLADELRRQEPLVKVLFVSGYAADGIVSEGVLAPGVALLHKPFLSFDLARKVREVLDAPPAPPA